MKNPVRLVLIVAAFALATGAQGADMLKYRGKAAAGKMRIDGTSTIHDWWAESTMVAGRLELDPSFPTDPSKTDLKPGPIPAQCTSTILVRTFKCQWGAPMDAIMQESMDATKFPKIEYKLKELSFKEAKDGALVFDSKGDLTVRGVTKEMAFPVRIERPDAKTVKIKGSVPTKMSDFKVPPPAPKAFGTIKTSEDIKLSFEWVLEQQPADAK
jgi:YceI-like domain